jgi:hypothetical protein
MAFRTLPSPKATGSVAWPIGQKARTASEVVDNNTEIVDTEVSSHNEAQSGPNNIQTTKSMAHRTIHSPARLPKTRLVFPSWTIPKPQPVVSLVVEEAPRVEAAASEEALISEAHEVLFRELEVVISSKAMITGTSVVGEGVGGLDIEMISLSVIASHLFRLSRIGTCLKRLSLLV